ncbi:BRCA1-associated protein [Copidosoma floridanum]|uniref:BRCA1-associated protein n=1 Tax=Copidosoma floridanum TaxID=29053 RepID=UPI0006C94708|nr:BRCA1-associated protein [Copidosoma floridanum]
MSSPEILVSLCVIRIEIRDFDLPPKDASAMERKNMQGSREPRDITVETYSDPNERPLPILPQGSGVTSKSHSISRENSEEKSYAAAVSASASNMDSSAGAAAACNVASDQINFISGNPFVEVSKGILHLYKENTLTEMRSAANQSNTICILSVPANMTCHDLMMFTAACHQNIQYFRIIRDGNPNHYMALLTFRSLTAASEFYETFNGAAYNSLEPEIVCHMVFVSKVETADNGFPLSGHTELPSCPVCLEKMDESVDGILTILCNHTFHASCLVKWGDTSCPVCRYAQTPEPIADSHCMECPGDSTNEALWICLICGHIGCGRYDQSHAFEHYSDTHHCYAMELGNNRVWDYVGDHWVDRLLQNKDGKMVEGGQESSKGERTAVDEKVDSVQLEFSYMLTSQLESQRLYFEELVAKVEQRNASDIRELTERVEKITEENSKQKNQLAALTREKLAIEKKLQHSNAKLTQIQAQLAEEKELRKALQDNQTSWQIKHKQLQDEMNVYKEKKETEINELNEQLRDLMFFLEAQKQIENSADKEEIASGRIVIEPSSNNPKSNQPKSKNKRDK